MTLRRLALALTCAPVLWTAPAAAATDPPALFAIFKAVCVDSDTAPDAVEAAVVKAGGLLDHEGTKEFVHGAILVRGRTWRVNVGGTFFTVEDATEKEAATETLPATLDTVCAVTRSDTDPDAIAAARDWVGVPASSSIPVADIYQYVIDGANHRAFPDGGLPFRQMYIQAVTDDTAAMLAIEHPGDHTTLTLLRSRVDSAQ